MGASRRRRAGAGLLVAVAVAAGVPSAPPATADGDTIAQMTRLVVIAGGKAARVRNAGYCLTTDGAEPGTQVHTCADVVYEPNPRRIFRLAGGSTVVLCAGHRAAGITLTLVHDDPHGPTYLVSRRARRLDSSSECWKVRLPQSLGSATSLHANVSYGEVGEADFVAGIKRDG
jgi:hypothetical protein